MANPQLEDGFMRVANGIVDNICKLSLNGTEQKVIWCVIRYTYGFNRRSHCLSASFISQWANCDISSVKRALRHLQKMNIIVCINADKRGVTAELKFNKNYDQWKLTGGRNDTMNELVYLKNDEAVCDSLQVAEKFGKEHKNVLQSIDNLIAENSAVKIMFKISSYKSGNGQSYRKFYMNRDGFSLLAMGFTGREALEWKLQYIRAFNQMENFIREKSTQMWVETRKAGKLTRKAETDTIQKLVEYAKGQGSSHAEMLYMTYSRLANKMAGINKRDEATVMQLNNLSLMENIILHEVDLGIMQGKHYQEIYRDCKKRLEAVKDLAYLEAV